MEIGQVIRMYRSQKGFSIRELARRSDVSHSYIAQLEREASTVDGKKVSPTLATLKSIADALEIPFDTFLDQIGK